MDKGSYCIVQFRNKVCKQVRQGAPKDSPQLAHGNLRRYSRRKRQKSICSAIPHTQLPAGSYSSKGRAPANSASSYLLQKTSTLMGKLSEQSMYMILNQCSLQPRILKYTGAYKSTLRSKNTKETTHQLLGSVLPMNSQI